MSDPINITIEPNAAEWEKASRGIVKPEEFKRALALAVNRALDQTKTEALRQVTSQYTIKRKDIADTIRTRKASAQEPTAELIFSGPRIDLMKFKVTPKQGLSFRGMSRQGRPQLFIQTKTDAGGRAGQLFVAKLGSKSPSVYRRKGPQRFPLLKATGPSIVSMVGNETSVNAIQSKAREVLDNRIDHEMRRMMDR